MFGRSSGRIDLPSVPAALARVIQITNNEHATAEEVAAVVMLDQSLATKVLRIANSAFYGRMRKAETITEAIVTLGFSSVRNLAASASVVDALFPSQMFPGFSWQDVWAHSVTCGLATEAIHGRISRGRGGKSEAAFVAGLLHDVGKLILARALPQRFAQVVETCTEQGIEMDQAEQRILSMNHAKIGGELTQEWDFPPQLQAGISWHHSPGSAGDYEDMATAVCAANLLAKRMGRSYLVGRQTEIGIKDVADAAGIRTDDVEHIIEQVRRGLRQCSDILAWGNQMPGADLANAA